MGSGLELIECLGGSAGELIGDSELTAHIRVAVHLVQGCGCPDAEPAVFPGAERHGLNGATAMMAQAVLVDPPLQMQRALSGWPESATDEAPAGKTAVRCEGSS